jgi:PiT family inorganic phosphate transporter
MSLYEALQGLSAGSLALLALALGIAFAFEFVNGFHDTANAVATVIYTRALRPRWAVLWSGLWNFLGVHAGGIGVAYSIVYLLPVDLLVGIDSRSGMLMVLAILVSALVWNLGTWALALPASSSHTLIGSILGVGMANSLLSGRGLSGINWTKAAEVAMSLLLSPLVGFLAAAVCLNLARLLLKDPKVHRSPEGDTPPPLLVRGLLIGTCTGVSFAHGSNDGQKGMGLIMLILIGMLPAHYAINLKSDPAAVREAAIAMDGLLANGVGRLDRLSAAHVRPHLKTLADQLDGRERFGRMDVRSRWEVRTALLHVSRDLKQIEAAARRGGTPAQRAQLAALRGQLKAPIEYVPEWVVMGVAVALGIGTTVGWKRIVVTVAEKIGKEHLTYSQGASAELVAMTTIGLADLSGLPVSTTHVLSSGIAGTMWANRSGVQLDTVKRIGLAWLLTLPAAMALAGGLYALGCSALV